MKSKYLILGSQGMLGQEFARLFGNNALQHARKSNSNHIVAYDFQNMAGVRQFFSQIDNVSTVLNCMALTNIDACEQNPDMAFWVNSNLPAALSENCAKRNIKFVHFSTDAVFDLRYPYKNESDLPNPKSIYGKSKLEGEIKVASQGRNNLILRVNFFSHSKANSLFRYFYDSFEAKNRAIGFNNVFFTPLSVYETVRVTLKLIDMNLQGLFHLVGDKRLSKYEFGELINTLLFNGQGQISQVEVESSEHLSLRSRDISLSNSKVRTKVDTLQTLSDGILEASHLLKLGGKKSVANI